MATDAVERQIPNWYNSQTVTQLPQPIRAYKAPAAKYKSYEH